jgi:hypothetical protein
MQYRNVMFDLIHQFKVQSVPELERKLEKLKRDFFMSMGLSMKLSDSPVNCNVSLRDLWEESLHEDTDDYQRILSKALFLK